MLDESPTVRSLSSRYANKDARFVFNSINALFIAQLPDGQFCLCDRGQNVYIILSELPSPENFNQIKNLLLLSRNRVTAEARFYGEPTDEQFIHDLRIFNKPQPRTPKTEVNLENLI